MLPLTSNGRHCDYAPAISLCLSRYLDDPEEIAPLEGTKEYWERVVVEQEADEERDMNRPQNFTKEDDDWDIGVGPDRELG